MTRGAPASALSSEQYLQAIINSSPLAIMAADLEASITLWNPAAEQLFGWKAEEVIGLRSPIVRPQDQPALNAIANRLIAGETFQGVEGIRVHKDGHEIPVVASFAPLRDETGRTTGMIALLRDITAQKHADAERERLLREFEEQLRQRSESEEKFRAVAETAASAIYIHDGQRMLYVNRAASEISGYSRDELMELDMWSLVHPEFRDTVKTRAAARLKGDLAAAPLRYEYKIIHKSGQERWLDFSAATVNFGGKRAVLATAFDVTEKKLAEEALRTSEKLAATGRLAATIAHEINNPLASVTNLLYLLGADGKLDQQAREMVDLAQQELLRVVHIVRQTLGFYRETSAPVRVKLSQVLDNVLELYERKIAESHVQVRRDYRSPGELVAFPGEMRQVFSNLLANALDATAAGGRLQLRVSTGVDWKRPDRRGVRVVVADSGSGIPAHLREKIFEPFFTTKGERGTGLGLWVTQGIVEKHGGRIRVRSRSSQPGSGTAFVVFLPAAPAQHHP